MNANDLAVKVEMQRQADEAMNRVKQLCRKAFEDGIKQGYAAGFRDGVVAMGPPPQQKQEAPV